MDPVLLQILVFVACFLAGSLAGINVDGIVVRFPAWRDLGAVGWATYSRKADLGNGLLLYPFLGIGHALLTIAVAIGLPSTVSAKALAAAYAAAGLAIVGLMLTARAAPIMLSLRRSGDDPGALETAFRGFAFWSLYRAVAQGLALVATLYLLVLVSA